MKIIKVKRVVVCENADGVDQVFGVKTYKLDDATAARLLETGAADEVGEVRKESRSKKRRGFRAKLED